MTLTELIRDIMYAMIIGVLPIIATYIKKYLDAKSSNLNKDSNLEIIATTLESTLNLISDAVSSTSQTYVDAMKKSGTFSKEAQEVAFNTTKNLIMSQLSDGSKEILKSLYNDLDKWIDIKIESECRKQKFDTVEEVK